jgi:hypothetical protein
MDLADDHTALLVAHGDRDHETVVDPGDLAIRQSV